MNGVRLPRTACRVAFWFLLTAAVGAVGWAVGCSSTPSPRHSRPSLLASVAAAPVYPSPASWRYHPKEEAHLAARLKLGKHRVLFAGERGERWLVKPKRRARAAAQLAPENLIGILRLEDGGWLFVGKSGTGYESRKPLGPFVRSSAPLDPLVRVTAADSTIAGVRQDGALVRSVDAGASWQPVGPADTRFVDIALQEGGQGLALAVPEQLWRTSDRGRSWERVPVDTVGAFGFARDKLAGLVVKGVLDLYQFESEPPGLSPLKRNLVPEKHGLSAQLPLGPDASALQEGRAVFVSGRYLELELSAKERDKWILWHGAPDEPLETTQVKKLEGCRTARLAGHDRWLTVACSRKSRSSSTQTLAFFRSRNRGKTFKLEDFTAEGKIEQLAMAMGAKGALLVSGVCPPHNASRGCKPQGVLFRRKAVVDAGAPDDERDSPGEEDDEEPPPEYELALSATPALKGGAQGLAFSTDGRIAYAVGRRTKNQAYAMFVSRDDGQTFEAHEIEQVARDTEDEESEHHRRPHSERRKRSVESVAAAEDGSVAVVFNLQGTSTLVVTDDQGRVISVSRPPSESATIGAVGTRALAFSTQSRQTWESLDGGGSWDSIGRLPLDFCPEDRECEVAVRCHLGGCVIGDELSRLGWHGQADDDQGMLSPPERRSPDLYDPKLRTPLSCTVDEEPWQALPKVTSAPTADQAAIGKAVWFMPTWDDDRASADMLRGYGGKRPRVETVTLLAPVAQPERYAYTVKMQIEGAVAARYAIPQAGHGSTRLKNVEVAWDNLLEGRLVRARIPDAGPYRPGDYVGQSGRAQHARPDLLSIGTGGLFVRIHYSARSAQETFFLNGRTVSKTPRMGWPTVNVSNGHREMAHIDGSYVPLMLLGRGTANVRARRAEGRWIFEAVATGLLEPGDYGLVQSSTIAYVNGRSGRHVMRYDASGEDHRGAVFPFRATGAVVDAPVEVPMQIDTGDQPLRCGSTQRSSTPRVVVPYQPGTRHPVMVVDMEEPLRVLLTGQAVMHGTPAAPCVAAFEAHVLSIDGGAEPQGETAILPLDDLEHSWLFRSAADETGTQTQIEYRTMSCRFDPNVRVPREVYQAPGARVRRRY